MLNFYDFVTKDYISVLPRDIIAIYPLDGHVIVEVTDYSKEHTVISNMPIYVYKTNSITYGT